MKFILNNDKLSIEEIESVNSGSIKFYEADVEHDEIWNNLNIEAIMVNGDSHEEGMEEGTSVAVINNKIYIDQNLRGRYLIGFVGYTIENEVKTYQISSDLKPVYFTQGAGEIKTTNAEDVPTPTEWEIYIAQIQEMIDESNFVYDPNYVHTDNNFTNEYKSDVDNNTIARHTHNNKTILDSIEATDITNWNNKAEISDIPDVSSFITKDVNNLTNYELKTETGHSVALEIDPYTYIITLSLKNSAGTILNTQTIDLPLETVVIGGTYDSTNKKIVLTLKNGNTIDIPVGDLISGLQTEITSSNKLSSDLVDDTNNTNKFVTTADKTAWNGKLDTSKVKTSRSTTSGDVYDVTYINSVVGNIETLLSGI